MPSRDKLVRFELITDKYFYGKMRRSFVFIWVVVAVFMQSCDNNVLEPDPPPVQPDLPDSLFFYGTGYIQYDDYEPLKDKPVRVFFHVPDDAHSQSPLLLAIHGNGRNAEESRNWLIDESEALRFIVLAPQFSDEFYPGSDVFHLGNIFEDGDNPSPETLNEETLWTYSIIDPIFHWFRSAVGSEAQTFDLFGHSAGGQFAHRFNLFKPGSVVNRVVAASAGWYTVPDTSIDFPYGIRKSPAMNTSPKRLFGRDLRVIVGSEDDDPDASALRHTDEAEAQGAHRLERAQHFYDESLRLASKQGVPCNWKFEVIPGVGHVFEQTSEYAAKMLYE